MASKLDLRGQKFGRLTVVSEAGRTKHGKVKWHCECQCGGAAVVPTGNLRSSITKSCGCLNDEQRKRNGRKNAKPIHLGATFGRWTVIAPAGSRSGKRIYLVSCECGTRRIVVGTSLTAGDSTSCGCVKPGSINYAGPKHHGFVDLTGKRFGSLVASCVFRVAGKQKHWLCRCDCGRVVWRNAKNLGSRGAAGCDDCSRRRGEDHHNYVDGMSRTKDGWRVYSSRRRAMIRGSEGKHYHQDWLYVLTQHESKCAGCGVSTGCDEVHKDHIAPLHTGGSDWVANIQPLCGSCNSSKGVQDFWLWMHKKHPDRCTPEYIAEWHAIRKRIDKWFLRRQQQAA